MNKTVGILLHDNSKLNFSWVKPGLLSVELLQPLTLRDGHGWWVVGSAQLEGPELTQFLAALQPPEEEPRPAA